MSNTTSSERSTFSRTYASSCCHKRTNQLAPDERLKVRAQATMPVYSCDLIASPHADDQVDAHAHHETRDDMMRLQAEGAYPAAFAAIKVPVLMIHGTYAPHPGRIIFESLRPHLPQLEYREFERCGHYPWLERATAGAFFLWCIIGCLAMPIRTSSDIRYRRGRKSVSLHLPLSAKR